MRNPIAGALVAMIAGAGLVPGQVVVAPVTPNASPEARALLGVIYRAAGRSILSGQHNRAGTKFKDSSHVHKATGKWPALWSSEFDTHAAVVAEAKREHAAGSIIALSWRVDEKQVESIAGYLKQLQEAHIPVLWRPSGAVEAASYRALFERLAVRDKLDNLIWVWDGGGDEKLYPGPAYCDVLAADVHGGEYKQSQYDALVKLAAGKPVALAEVDAPPSAEVLEKQPMWTWFVRRSRAGMSENDRAAFASARTANRGDKAPPAAEPTPCEPVNPHATAEARALLKSICAVSGKFILSGQHNFPNHFAKWSDETAAIVGKYPAIWGSDFGFTGGDDKDSILGRDAMIEEAKRQFAAGAIITLMWHVVRPMDDEPVLPLIGWRESVQAKLTNFEWNELITPGTNLHRRWLAQIDTVVPYLRRLQDAKIPVLWRPYHEHNGNWFWWGGRKGENGFAALYRMTYDRLVNTHHLDNLIWVWNTGAPNGLNCGPFADYNPGLEYYDVLATDIYGEFKQSYHDDLLALAKGKPIAIGECAKLPTLENLKSQPKWAWFMIWADLFKANQPEVARELFADPHTLSRGDPLPK